MTIKIGESDTLNHLNPEQREAVTHKTGPSLVIAGAGTGKTRVITERISYILGQKWCKNNQILALTFTEKAAGEMEERLDVLMPIGYEAIQVSTFHSFCEKLLRQYGIDIGISPNFKILEGVRQWQFMKENLFEFELSYYRPLGNPTKFIDALLSHFGRLKEELNSPENYLKFAKEREAREQSEEAKMEAKRLLELANAYAKYQELLEQNSYLDFSDLQYKIIELLEKRPNILKHLQKAYQYILVDEYQDTNIAQNRIVDLLSEQHKNIMVVGDDDQSIYKFRGAAISNILQFEEKYTGAKKVVLTQNYRSNQKILDFAYTSIQKNNPDRLEIKSNVVKKLTALRPGGDDSVILAHCSTIEQEVEYAVEAIKKAEVPLSEIAVLVRANHYAQPFIEAFRKANIPYQFLSERGLYDKPEIKKLISVLRVLANPTDDISFYEVLRMPVWNIKMETIAELITTAKKQYTSVWNQIKKNTECEFLAKVIADLLEYSKDHTIGEALYRFTDTIQLYDRLLKMETIEAEERITNIATFFNKVRQFERESEYKTVIDFVAYLELSEEAGDNPSAKFDVAGMDGVQISTIHGVKGLEFNTVFVANLVNRRFPTDNRKDPIEMPNELVHEILNDADVHTQEERRLFYVACTRAKEKLHLLHSDFYSASNAKNPRPNKRSRFIDEVIDEVVVTQVEKTVEGVERFLKPKSEILNPKFEKIPSHKSQIINFSYSQLTTFQSCPRQYQYSYIYKIPQPPSGALSFGITLHNTLLEFYRHVNQSKQASLFTEYDEDLSYEKLITIYGEKWINQGYESKSHMEASKERGKEILELFYGHFKERIPQIEFLEKGFKLKVGDYTISGRIDRADKMDSGTLEIIDYKTGKAKKQDQVDKDLQLQIYALATSECFQQPASKMTLYFLDEDNKVSTEPDAKKFEKVKAEIVETADQINSSDFSPTPSKFTCQFCSYRKICDSAA
ncbi:ATP-dependent helicase [candidate division KSB1 bacterium]